MSKHRPPVVSINRYLAREESKGPDEEGVEYTRSNLDMIYLLHLLKDGNNPLRNIACIPNWELCEDKLSPHFNRCSRRQYKIRAGIIISGILSSKPQLWVPDNWKDMLAACRKKRFTICNLGLYDTLQRDGHANSLIFDNKNMLIERFDPGVGNTTDPYDPVIEHLFKTKIPHYTYVGTKLAAPRLNIQQIVDSFDGLCVTFSLMYTLYRLSNPNFSSKEVQEEMLDGTPTQLRRRALRLNKSMLKVAKRAPVSHSLRP
jgi:hypothetical protein